MKENFNALFSAMRLPFLLLTFSVIFLALSITIHSGAEISVIDSTLVFIGALSAHISVNLLNEYQDFHSGLDFLTVKTPFSSGSGALITTPSAASFVAKMSILFLFITSVIGVYFALTTSLKIIAIGLFGIAIIVFYTKWINKLPIICLICSGLAFGPLMVLGTSIVLVGNISWNVVLISLVPFFLTNNLLLINQFPDINADKQVGRNHFSIKYGMQKSIYVYLIFLLLALVNIVFVIFVCNLQAFAYLAIAPTLIAFCLISLLNKKGTVITHIISAMRMSVINAVVTPSTLAIALCLA